MKLALFSHNLDQLHVKKLKTFFNKDLSRVRFLYITTPTNYKPYLPDWSFESEKLLRSVFPLLREFDLERAYKVDKEFDFKAYLSQFEFVFVSGGNTFILTYWMKKTGVGRWLSDQIRAGRFVYGGESAGAIFAYKDVSTYAEADDPKVAPAVVTDGLDLVNFAPIPHWGNPEFQVSLEKIKRDLVDKKIEVITINDNQAIFVDDKEVLVI